MNAGLLRHLWLEVLLLAAVTLAAFLLSGLAGSSRAWAQEPQPGDVNTVTVIKEVPSGDGQDFVFDPGGNCLNLSQQPVPCPPNLIINGDVNFILDDDSLDGTWPESRTFGVNFSGRINARHFITELPVPGWTITDIACQEEGIPQQQEYAFAKGDIVTGPEYNPAFNLGDDTLWFNITNNQGTLTCTFTNEIVAGTDDTLTVTKVCDDGAVGPFGLSLRLMSEEGQGPSHELQPPIDCGETATYAIPLDVINFLQQTPGAAVFLDEDGPSPVFEGPDCGLDGALSLPSAGDDGAFGGMFCTIFNPSPDLLITKVCPEGLSAGDADFEVLVAQLESLVAADALDCGEVMPLVDLPVGIYRIEELITGPDANDFLSAIVCSSADGQDLTPGTRAEVELERGVVECAIVNFFDPSNAADPTDPGATPAPPAVIVPIDIDNSNTNALNNDNLNSNNNENTNTQEQSNLQEQTNHNNQTTAVNSSPSVVIDFDD